MPLFKVGSDNKIFFSIGELNNQQICQFKLFIVTLQK